MSPLCVLFIGLVLVVGMIVFLRMNAFLALLAGALVVSFLAGGVPDNENLWVAKVTRVTEAMGTMAGKIGVLIVMGALIGHCLTASGAADKIVRSVLGLFGPKRMTEALLSGGFLLAIPVFYDASFYLLLPLAKSVYRMEGKHYIRYLLAIGFGCTLAHTLVPPTPGPLMVAGEMGISIGMMMLLGAMVGLGTLPFALLIARWIDSYLPHPEIVDRDQLRETETVSAPASMPLWVALLPILLPVLLISSASICNVLTQNHTLVWTDSTRFFEKLILLAGNAEVALSLGALLAAWTLKQARHLTLRELETHLTAGISTAGMIILITSAGGAFGAMLRVCGVGEQIKTFVASGGSFSGIGILLVAFGVAAMIKTAQGSSTTAMITTAGIFSAMALSAETLGFHPGYLAVVTGVGSCVTGWMNDSGFCIFSQMSGIRETDALKTWTVGLALMGLAGLCVTMVLSQCLPLV
ncbi:MAG: SLC13 family permease [Planctomycetia bacterium]|nr:SLC13 family permease [Planctomycetia bacterium]